MIGVVVRCKRHGVIVATVEDTAPGAFVRWQVRSDDRIGARRQTISNTADDEMVAAFKTDLQALDLHRSSRDQRRAGAEVDDVEAFLAAVGSSSLDAWCAGCGKSIRVPVAGLRSRHAEHQRTETAVTWRLPPL